MRASTEELITFVTVVECGSFSRGAERLGQDNSVVSRTVKRLEQKLEVTLLNRTTRQLSLTQEGERYFNRISKLINDMREAEDDLMEKNDSPRGSLRIDAATPVILHVICPIIAEFNERYPKISLSLFSSESNINLIEKKVDVAVRIGKLSDSSLRARELMLSFRHVLASPDYLEKWGMPVGIEDLENHRCLGFSEVGSLNKWPLLCADGQQLTVTPFISSASGETLRRLCLEGNGIACLSDFMTDNDVRQGRLVKLFENDITHIAMPFSAVYYGDQVVNKRIRCFIDFLAEKLNARNNRK